MIDGGDVHANSVVGRIDEIAVVGGDPFIARSVPRGGSIAIRGWMLDRTSGGNVDRLTARIGHGGGSEALLNFRRKDVAGAFEWATSAFSGFYAVLPVDVNVGSHTIHLTAEVNGEVVALETNCTVEVARTIDPLAGCVERNDGWAFAIDGFFTFDDPVSDYRDGDVSVVPFAAPTSLKLWVVDVRLRKAATAVVARLGGTYLSATNAIERADVAMNLGIADARYCGFAIPIVGPTTGTAALELFALSADGSYVRLPTVRVQQPKPISNAVVPFGAHVQGRIDDVLVDGRASAFGPAIAVERGQAFALRGWSIDPIGPRLTGGVEIDIGDAPPIAAVRGAARPDIAENFGHSALVDSEFRVTVPTADLETGLHRVVVRALSARRDRQAIIAETTLTIEPARTDP